MPNRSVLLSKINEKMNALASRIRTVELLDSEEYAITTRQLCRYLLNQTYGYKLDDTEGLSGINLVDSNLGVAAQVTITASPQEILETIELFRSFELQEQFRLLIILVVTMDPQLGNGDRYDTDDFRLYVMHFPDLFKSITYLPIHKLRQIEAELEKVLSAEGQDISTENPETPVPVPTPLSVLTPSMRQVLLFASLLPEDGLDSGLFRHGLNRSQQKAADQLRQYDWLLQTNQILQLNPKADLSEITYTDAAEAELVTFLDLLWDYERSWRWYRVPQKDYTKIKHRMAKLYRNAAQLLSGHADIYARRSAEFWMSVRRYSEALEMEEKALELLDSTQDRCDWDTVYLRHLIAFCYSRLRLHEQALAYRQEVLDLCLRNSVPDADIAVAYRYVGRTYTDMGRYDEARKPFEEEVEILKRLRTCESNVFPYLDLADAYDKLSFIHGKLEHAAEKEYYNLLAKSVREETSGPPEDLVNALFRENLLPRHLLPGVPPASEFFSPGSRDQELELLEERLDANGIVFVHGIGGSGKTEFAIQLAARRKSSKGTYFLQYYDSPGDGEAMRETILRADFSNYLFRGTDSANREKEYRERMEILKTEYPGALLIIDNFNRRGKTLADLLAEASYRELTSAGIQLVFLTRSACCSDNGITLRPLDEDRLLQLMRENLSSDMIGSDILRELIRVVDGHTYLVILIAKALSHTPDMTPEWMLAALRRSEAVRANPGTGSALNKAHLRIYTLVKTILDLSGIRGSDLVVLGCAAMLPENGMDQNLFRECLPLRRNKQATIQKLIDRGFLRQKNNLLTIHSIIRQTCLFELDTSEETYKSFFEELWNKFSLDRSFDKKRIRQIASCFSMASDILWETPADLPLMASMCWDRLGMPWRALAYLRRAQELWEEIPLEEAAGGLLKVYNNLGITYRNLGALDMARDILHKAQTIHGQLSTRHQIDLNFIYTTIIDIYNAKGDFETALCYALKALDIVRKDREGIHPVHATACHNVGNVYMKLEKPEKAQEYLIEGMHISEQTLPARDPKLAVSYSAVANVHAALARFNEARKYQQKALDILEAILPREHPDLATSYISMGGICGSLGDHYRALEYKLKALTIRKRVLPPEHPNLASVYFAIGASYHALGDLEYALEYRQKALEIREKILPENHPDLVASYNSVGWTYLQQQDYRLALEYFQKVQRMLDVEPVQHPQLLAVTNNRIGTVFSERARREDALTHHEDALTHFKVALDLFGKILEPDHPDLVTARINISETHLALKEHDNARIHLKQALEIRQRLYPALHPQVRDLENAIERTYDAE